MHNLVDESFNDPAFLEALKAAQVVFGMDSLTGQEHLFFGQARLAGLVRRGVDAKLRVLRIPIQNQDEINSLGAACIVVKGSCCLGGVRTTEKTLEDPDE